jgi:hypothetical protein
VWPLHYSCQTMPNHWNLECSIVGSCEMPYYVRWLLMDGWAFENLSVQRFRCLTKLENNFFNTSSLVCFHSLCESWFCREGWGKESSFASSSLCTWVCMVCDTNLTMLCVFSTACDSIHCTRVHLACFVGRHGYIHLGWVSWGSIIIMLVALLSRRLVWVVVFARTGVPEPVTPLQGVG